MKLSDYLAQEKLTQAQFAELVGAHPITVNKWATGNAMPRRAQVAKIREVTDGRVTAGDLAAAFAFPSEPSAGASVPHRDGGACAPNASPAIAFNSEAV